VGFGKGGGVVDASRKHGWSSFFLWILTSRPVFSSPTPRYIVGFFIFFSHDTLSLYLFYFFRFFIPSFWKGCIEAEAFYFIPGVGCSSTWGDPLTYNYHIYIQ